jgi:hypothetical protein
MYHMKLVNCLTIVVCSVLCSHLAIAAGVPINPYLMPGSVYPVVHFDAGQTDATWVPMWKGEHNVSADQVELLPATLAIPGNIHRPYDDGTEAMLVTNNASVLKLRIDGGRWERVDELVSPGLESSRAAPERMAKLLVEMDGAWGNEDALLRPLRNYLEEVGFSVANAPNGLYTALDRDGYMYAGYGTTLYKIGDQKSANVEAKLEIVASVDMRSVLPPDLARHVNRFLGLNMTYDGYVVVAMPGLIAAVSRDFGKVYTAPIPGEAVDNSIAIDPQGGVFVVTDQYMRKLVWTGDRLSMDEADGAWAETYDYVKEKPGLWLSRGSGATPSLMGFGEDEDRLVFIPDAGDPVKLLAFWRDEIPEDARGVPGARSSRLADSIPLGFPVATTVEWSSQVLNNGIMVMASDFPDPITSDGPRSLFTTLATMGYTRVGPRGAEKFSWDSKSNSLKRDWIYMDRNVTWTMTPVSIPDNATYLNTLVDGEWRIIGLDWDSGEKVADIKLPNSYKFNSAGGFLMPLPDGDLFASGMFGPVRIRASAK